MAEKWEMAELDYKEGMKYKDIADKYDVSMNTVKSWKTRYQWVRDKSAPPEQKSVHTKQKGTHTIEKGVHTQKAIEEIDDSGLTDKQKLFAVEYIKSFNATQSYINAYGVGYETAMVNGSKLLRNTNVSAEIERLRKARLQDIGVTKNDLLAELAKQAFADVGDYIEFGGHDEFAKDANEKQLVDTEGNPIINHRSFVQLKDKSLVDTSMIKQVSQGRNGVVLELYDKQNAQRRLLEEINKAELDKSNGETEEVKLVFRRGDADGD